jgi:nitric-oxide synthase
VYEDWKQYYWPHLGTLLDQFPGVRPDAAVLATMLPLLQPRFYSVSSSPRAHPTELHLTVAVVSYRTKGGEGPTHFGVCSNYLNEAPVGSLVPAFVRNAAGFHLPKDGSKPLIMIGPGTGIAPFRGFWQERRLVLKGGTGVGGPNSTKWGRMTLFFGCRTKEMILYRRELEELKRESVLADIYLALSREPNIKKVIISE